MKLRAILEKITSLQAPAAHPALDTEITGLQTNSHACGAGDLFIGMPGTRVDGGEFWPGAIEGGAIAAVISPGAAQKVPGDACIAVATDMIQASAQIATAFYHYPAQTLKMVGVTGTNGKTTTTHILEFLLAGHQSTALLGTLYTRWQGFQQVATHTTPFAIDLQRQLAAAVTAGCETALMEVSSHALDQGRVKGCPFEIGIFTNLTQDHLDYHKDMESYFQAKALLFSEEYLKGRGIINYDDAYGRKLIQALSETKKQVWSYSPQNNQADLWTDQLTYSPTGVSGILHTPQGDRPFSSPLVGDYNLANVLAAVGAALHLGLDLDSIVAAIAKFPGVPGRMEQVKIDDRQDISVIVDYAHTPDSLDNLLKAARPFISGQMICVFGCGGDRDRTKRPQMGKIAAELADLAIVTSDNPRTEDPEKILADVLAGIPSDRPVKVIADRATAIATAIQRAQPGDGVLIAGKGHEDYQIIGTEKIHFDDREQARAALAQRS